jgi:hypothetical protein
MKTKFAIIALLLAIGLAGCGVNDTKPTAAAQAKYMTDNGLYSIDFNAFDKDYKAMTDIQKKEYLKSLNNPTVEWTGYVNNVTTKEIFVGVSAASSRNFDAEVTADQMEMLPSLKKEQRITIRGKLIRPGILTGWVIREAKIIK